MPVPVRRLIMYERDILEKNDDRILRKHKISTNGDHMLLVTSPQHGIKLVASHALSCNDQHHGWASSGPRTRSGPHLFLIWPSAVLVYSIKLMIEVKINVSKMNVYYL
ncbi:hypothetical protein RF11_14686 [Thelohanellus kitauei]|uniref:Uncharacterized protein n=1 Tax=Thelohanellus kitauei TaxID=669202 RepID=A0A0C2N412_THEKT|nr:hypothetical protein RF11_14686 [Thelohanellus kitauei]